MATIKDRLCESEYVREQREIRKQGSAQVHDKAQAALQKVREAAEEAKSIFDKRKRLEKYTEARIAEVKVLNIALEHKINDLSNILRQAISGDPHLDLDALKQNPKIPAFDGASLSVETPPVPAFDAGQLAVEITPPTYDPGPLAVKNLPPDPSLYEVPPLSRVEKVLPGAIKKHNKESLIIRQRFEADLAAYVAKEAVRQKALAAAKAKYEADLAAYATKERARQEALAEAKAQYDADMANYAWSEAARQNALAEAKAQYESEANRIQETTKAHNDLLDKLKQDFAAGMPDAICDYYLTRLALTLWPEDFPQHVELAFVPESKQLVVEYDLPSFEAIPEVGSYKYVKATGEIRETLRPANQRKALYSSVIAQIVLVILDVLFNCNRTEHVDTIVLNGYVEAIDRATGRSIRPCLVTVRATRDTFDQLDLKLVDPAACLKFLSASVSKSPAELTPVRPVLELNLVDPRFVQESDILSQLDQRPNLMDLTPSEFESLITNLFQEMGLETRQTQASRDGGVDCVAFDTRPIFGGKVVIQAKRYKNTVGVSAVRDLFGTVQNEGASKGILVTTSGYGEASYEFAKGKPLELLSGSNLLALLAEHAGIEAKIVVPENWKDPHPDSVGNT